MDINEARALKPDPLLTHLILKEDYYLFLGVSDDVLTNGIYLYSLKFNYVHATRRSDHYYYYYSTAEFIKKFNRTSQQ